MSKIGYNQLSDPRPASRQDALPAPLPSNDGAIADERNASTVVGSARLARRETRDFQLRANGSNRLLEVAMPLLGLATRIRGLGEFDSIDALHGRLVNEVEIFHQEVEAMDYDEATTLAVRYIICAAVDEAVLSQPWGAESNWPERPLLSIYHNETWGGEKVFDVLDRVMDEAHRYVDLLEFIYYVIALGFEGKYHVMHSGQQRLEDRLSLILDRLAKYRGVGPDRLLVPEPNIYDKPQSIDWQFPVWSIVLFFVALLVSVHIAFDISLSQQIDLISTDIYQTLGIEAGDVLQ